MSEKVIQSFVFDSRFRPVKSHMPCINLLALQQIYHVCFFPQMTPKKKASREEILLKKKLRERERYKKIKSDPVKLEQQREKERIKYENKKNKKQVKSINDMNEREARLKRKEWRARSKKYYNKKKQIAQEMNYMLRESPPSTDESRPASPVQRHSGRKRIHRDRSKIIQRNKKLIHENSRLKTMLEKYRKRCYRAKKATCKKNESEMTPRSKVKTIMKSKDKQLYPLADENFQKAGTSKDQTTQMHNIPDHTYNREETDAEIENDGNIPNRRTTSNEVSWDKIKPGKFVLAEFMSKKKDRKYRYVCSVQKKR
ncbi:hypothetical protein LSTR_LSTR000340 [Laodelphax striatellus]|uniref:Uncharacterized protein n=1 Tax=Laodelphax striatellus TaxID=195883 RepID=A0A482X7I2_LAOST|nr:hypothetical protein LSTR_LSTR000340 [Laodelphax striatellus]